MPRRWVVILLRRIAALPGVAVAVERAPGSAGCVGVLLRLEALLARRSLTGWAAPAAAADLPAAGASPTRCDLVLDLRGDAAAPPDSRVWRLSFDGATGEAALLAALLAGRSPVVALHEGGAVVASARLGTEAHGDLLATVEDALARTTTLVLAALRGLRPRVEAWEEPPAPALSPGAVAGHVARRSVRLAANGLRRLRTRSPHWRVGWRRLDGPDLIDLRAHPDTGWTDLPDDGSRFYADPFPIVHGGGLTLFVEDYAHRRGKGVISAVPFGPDGPVGVPVPVLEEPHHLSYPFVFARDGAVWMIPESSAAGTIDLYRATAFPGGWVRHATLVCGIAAGDATLVEHGGLWWMFATVREAIPEAEGLPPRGASSDALHLWSAPDFRGPWTAHAGNPVLIDAAAARPAGRVVARDGALIRPVQDCRAGYGAALALARIDRLDAGGYAQTVETRIGPGPAWTGTCLHTLNRAGGFEFIDGSGRGLRFGRRRIP